MPHGDTAQLAAVIGALGAPIVLLARTRGALLSGFLILAIAEGMLGYALANGVDASRVLRPGPAAAAIVAIGILGVGAGFLARYPALVTPLVLAAAPFRLPIDFGREHRFFVSVAEPGQLGRLLLLYAVLAAATLALIWRVLRSQAVSPLPRVLAIPASVFVALASLSLLWTVDLPAGVNVLTYFLLPFVVLVGVVGRSPFPQWLPRALAIVGASLACIFAAVGLFQAATHKLFFYSSNIEVANTYASFFRVTSLFRDPSLYGRHLVLGIAIVLVALWLGKLRIEWALPLIALMWGGLYFSYSQSSMVALFLVVVLVTAVVGDRRGRQLVAVVAAVLVLGGAGVVAAVVKDESLQRATQDRSRRVADATDVFRDNPIYGVGIGAQPAAAQQSAGGIAPTYHYVSHTTPLTIAGELGIVGLLAYLGLLVGALRMIDLVRRRDLGLGLTLGAVFVALFVHSLFYSGFVEDPVTWFVLAVAASFLVARVGVTEPALRYSAHAEPPPPPHDEPRRRRSRPLRRLDPARHARSAPPS